MQLLPFALIATAIGLITASYVPVATGYGGLAAVALVLLLVGRRRCSAGLRLCLIAVLFFGCVAARYPAALQPSEDVSRIGRLGQKVTIVAEEAKVSQLNEGRTW